MEAKMKMRKEWSSLFQKEKKEKKNTRQSVFLRT